MVTTETLKHVQMLCLRPPPPDTLPTVQPLRVKALKVPETGLTQLINTINATILMKHNYIDT